jgi:hypothetical protein
MTIAPKRRWPRFTLRTLFVAVTVLGAASSWVHSQLDWIKQRHAARHQPHLVTYFSGGFIDNDGLEVPPADPPLSLWFFGEDGVTELTTIYDDDHS